LDEEEKKSENAYWTNRRADYKEKKTLAKKGKECCLCCKESTKRRGPIRIRCGNSAFIIRRKKSLKGRKRKRKKDLEREEEFSQKVIQL